MGADCNDPLHRDQFMAVIRGLYRDAVSIMLIVNSRD